MKSIVTKDFGVSQAKWFDDIISYPLANVYVMLGKALAWNTAESVEQPLDTTQYKTDCLNQGIVMVRLNSSGVQTVLPRVDWANGSVYYEYTQNAELCTKSVTERVGSGNVNVSLTLANTVVANGINFTTDTPIVSVGSIIKISDEKKEVVRVNTAGDYLVVNTGFSSAYSSNNLYKVSATGTSQYYFPFYVRNSYDQVFKCLANSVNGTTSTVMPQIALDGQLPENPYIETSDGYKWKYLYTIPSGLKNKFFTDKYMPVIRENVVYENSVGGRIDIINVTYGGSSYYSGSSLSNYQGVVQITGDGTGATASVDVVNGVITAIHIINGGSGYTYATVSISDPLKLSGGTTATFDVVIGPQYGHGHDAARELGASQIMMSVDFSGDVGGYYPIMSDGTDDFRRVCIIKDPKLATGSYATGETYSMFTTLYLSNPPVDYQHDGTVYVGNTYSTAEATGKVIHFATGDNIMYINDIRGNFLNSASKTLYQNEVAAAVSQIYGVSVPEINILSGEILYIENRSPIVRNLNQTETIKIVFEF